MFLKNIQRHLPKSRVTSISALVHFERGSSRPRTIREGRMLMMMQDACPWKLYRKAATAIALAAVLLAPPLVVQDLAAQQYPSGRYQQQDQNDPPGRVARVSYLQGNVSLEPASVDTFSQAEINFPLTAGDRLYADNNSLAELQTAGLALRLGNGADVTLSTLSDDVAQFGLAQGSIRLRIRDLSTPDGQQSVVEVDTPNGTILIQRPGDIRVDSYPQDDTTVVTVTSGLVQVTGPNLNTSVGPNQSIRLTGTNPVYTELLRVLPPDALDQFDTQREREREQSFAASAPYVDDGMIGVSDLGQYGNWNPNPDYGQVWFPRAVRADWTPYSNGHWAWVAPWGWTWIEAEPWGFAPFHYGRWANFDGRWGWVPGPPPAVFGGRPPRPIYSPALVAFVGGSGLSLSRNIDLTAWFPLGPREPYAPWYHASPAYVNRVNVTNIYNRNVNEVRHNYNNRTTNVYNTNVTNITYVNRQGATTAVAQRDFADGRRIADIQRIRPDANLQRQLAQAPILPHPLVTPTSGSAAPRIPARALPPNQARPVVETRDGFERAGAPNQPGNRVNNQAPINPRAGSPEHNQPAIQPMQAPQKSPARAPALGPQPGGVHGGFPQQRDHEPGTPFAPTAQPAPTETQEPTRGIIPSQNRPPYQAPPVQQPARVQPSTQAPQPSAKPGRPVQAQPQPGTQQANQQGSPGGSQGARPVPRPPDQPRALINQTLPQAPQPAFVQQQQAMQKSDPGRPLGPQQVDNVRNGRPAGAPSQPEAIPHPAPAQQRPNRQQDRSKDNQTRGSGPTSKE